MSRTLEVVLSALGAGLLTLLGTYIVRLREEYALRAAALQVVKDELLFACQKITAALEGGVLWPPALQLAPRSWDHYRDSLASRLNHRSWSDIQALVRRLEVADVWANEQRDENALTGVSTPLTDTDLRDELEQLQKDLNGPSGVLVNARRGAERRVLIGRLSVGLLVAAAVAGVIALAVSGPALTSDALAHALKTQLPGSQQVICDKTKSLDGTYICNVGFPRCAGELSASISPPRCPAAREQVYQVSTQGTCYAASLLKVIRDGQQSPSPASGRITKALVRWGCKKA